MMEWCAISHRGEKRFFRGNCGSLRNRSFRLIAASSSAASMTSQRPCATTLPSSPQARSARARGTWDGSRVSRSEIALSFSQGIREIVSRADEAAAKPAAAGGFRANAHAASPGHPCVFSRVTRTNFNPRTATLKRSPPLWAA